MDGRYEALKSDDPVMSMYLLIRNSPVPRLIPVTASFTAFLVSYYLLSGPDVVMFAASLIYSLYVIYESLKLVRLIRSLSR